MKPSALKQIAHLGRAALIAALVLAGIPVSALGQTLNAEAYLEVKERAEAAYREGRYGEAAEAFRTLLDHNPGDGDLWIRLGRAHERAEERQQAIEAFQRARALGYATGYTIDVWIAALYADMDDQEGAYEWLERALADGLEGRNRISQHRAFKRYEDDDRYRRLAGLLPQREFTRDEGWRYDLDYLVEEIRRLHAAFERPAFSPEFETAMADIHERIPRLTDDQIANELKRLVVRLGDGHSAIWSVPTDDVSFAGLPIDVYLFSDGPFIVGAGGADAQELIGSRLLQVGGRPVEELIPGVEPYLAVDNPMGVRSGTAALITRLDLLEALGATREGDAMSVTVAGPTDGTRTATLTAGPPRRTWRLMGPPADASAPTPLYLSNPTKNIWLEELPDHQALYVQYNSVSNERGNTVADFADTLLAAAERTGSSTVIVDVRRNGGGNNFLNWPLVRALIRFEHEEPDRRIFVLAGRHTFSAAQNFVNWVERLTDAVFVGEPTGSRPNFTGETTPVTLPYSGLQGSISSRYWQDSHANDDRIWIAPDIPVGLSSEDYFSNRDPVLEAVLRLIESGRTIS
jgi:tetratricopeptide (TPR) repeat protein